MATMTKALSVMQAHLPTWFKARLREAALGKHSYRHVGWHLMFYHPEQFELEDAGVDVLTATDVRNPSATLRRIFASEEHPDAGLVDYIPYARRADFLEGMILGARQVEWRDVAGGEAWVAVR